MGKKIPFEIIASWLPDDYKADLAAERNAIALDIQVEIKKLLYCETSSSERIVCLFQRFHAFRYEYKPEEVIDLVPKLLQLILEKKDLGYIQQSALCRSLHKVLRGNPKLPGLIVPWRPLYELIKKLYFPKSRHVIWVPKHDHEKSLVQMIRKLRPYFAKEAASELMNEMRPFLCPHDSKVFFGYGILTLFLPSSMFSCEKSKKYGNYEREDISWLEEMLSVWSWREHLPSWDCLSVQFLARIIRSCKSISWEPFMEVIFSKLLHLVANSGTPLPIGTANYQVVPEMTLPSSFNIFFKNERTAMRPIGMLIVDLLSPSSSAQMYLSQLMAYIEPYFHPSNHGAWSQRLGTLMQSLCTKFSRRVTKEKEYRVSLVEEGGEEPSHFSNFLGHDDIDRFVLCMFPIVMKALYSKRRNLGSMANISIKHLAFIRPHLILPQLLETIIGDLQSLEQSHRVQASLEVLGVTTRPLLWREHFPIGGEHLSNLLCLSLPGIDPNDLMKTLATIRFYSGVLINVPLFDCSESGENPSGDAPGDEGARIASGYFADWASQFLERALVLYSFTVSHESSGEISLESAIHNPLYRSLELLFQQSSPPLYRRLVQQLFDFVRSSNIPTAINEIGDLCEVACFAYPALALDIFVPHFASILLPISDSLDVSHLSTSELQWNLTILSRLLTRAGPALLSHRNTLERVIKSILCAPNVLRKVFELGGKLLRQILLAITSVYTTDIRSIPRTVWESETFQRTAYKYWGCSGDPSSALDIQWHIPSPDELSWASYLIETYGSTSLDKLQILESSSRNAMDTSDEAESQISSKDRKEIWKALFLLHMIQDGSSIIISHKKESEEAYKRSDHFHFDITFAPSHLGTVITNPIPCIDSSFNYTRIGKMLCALTLLLNDSDDTKLLELLITTMDQYINSRYGSSPTLHTAALTGASFAIGSPHLPAVQSVRYFMVQRASILHNTRLFAKNYTIPFTTLTCDVVACLVTLSVHRYSQVRSLAQPTVSITLSRFSISASLLFPQLVEYLGSDAPPHHVTGAIYLLHTVRLLTDIIGDWHLFHDFISVLLLCYQHEDINVQNRIVSLFGAIIELFYSAPISHVVLPNFLPPNEKIEKLCLETAERERFYHETIIQLTSAKLPWNYTSALGNILMLLIRQDYKPPVCMVLFFHTLLSSEVILHRRLAFGGLSRIFLVYKPTRPRKEVKQIIKESLPRISVLQYQNEVSSPPTDSDAWESTIFHDKNYYGWGQIPFVSKVYVAMNVEEYEEQKKKFHTIPSLAALLPFFQSPIWWDDVMKRLVAETNNIYFMKSIAQCFKGFFQIFNDSFLGLLFPRIQALATNYIDKGSQVLACHMIGGLVRGSKHWPFDLIEKMWDFVIPTFMTVLENANAENMTNWMMCINFCVYDRDPKRLDRLYKAFENSASVQLSGSSIVFQANKIDALHGIVAECSWKGTYMGDRLLSVLKGQLCVDRKLLRTALADLSGSILSGNFDGLRNELGLPRLVGRQEMNGNLLEFVQEMIRQLERFKPEMDSNESKEYVYCCKFILHWIISCFQAYSSFTLILYLPPLLPHLLAMRNEDKTLQYLQFMAVGYIANAEMSESLATEILKVCYGQLRSPSWHTRATILPFMQVLVFRNIFLLRKELPAVVEGLVLSLVDPQIEVRALASTSLAGVLKFIEDDSLIQSLEKRFMGMAAIPLPSSKKDPTFFSSVLQRHGGVLGIAALTRIHPYEIPSWLPKLLVSFATHIHDPMPIAGTVKKTFLEFWRVHQDAWATEKLLFSSSELTVLTELLVSPSYFA